MAPGPRGGTTIHAIIRGEPGGLARILNPIMARVVKRSVDRDHRRLKELLDRDSAPETDA